MRPEIKKCEARILVTKPTFEELSQGNWTNHKMNETVNIDKFLKFHFILKTAATKIGNKTTK
jgi:hypothetical protein